MCGIKKRSRYVPYIPRKEVLMTLDLRVIGFSLLQ